MKKWKNGLLLLSGISIVLFFMEISGIGCPIKWFTGISCAGCGMTRAVWSALQLQFDRAFHYHPLFWILLPGAFVYLLWDKIPRNCQKVLTGAVILCFMAVYLFRLFDPEDTVVTADLHSSLPARLLNRLLFP